MSWRGWAQVFATATPASFAYASSTQLRTDERTIELTSAADLTVADIARTHGVHRRRCAREVPLEVVDTRRKDLSCRRKDFCESCVKALIADDWRDKDRS
jgi:hypothetical protein